MQEKDDPGPAPGVGTSRDGAFPDDLSEVMDFSRYDLRTTIRLIVLSGESRRVEIKRGSRQGSIYIKEGEIYRVETNELAGDEALFDILSWDKAVHTDSRHVELPEANVRVSTPVLLNLMKAKT